MWWDEFPGGVHAADSSRDPSFSTRSAARETRVSRVRRLNEAAIDRHALFIRQLDEEG